MPKILYNGRNGRFDIVDIDKTTLRELLKLLDESAMTDEMKKLLLDLEDDKDIMNIDKIDEKELPF